jgi:hypothetical protein
MGVCFWRHISSCYVVLRFVVYAVVALELFISIIATHPLKLGCCENLVFLSSGMQRIVGIFVLGRQSHVDMSPPMK